MNIGIESILTYIPEGKMEVPEFYKRLNEDYDYIKTDEEIDFFMNTSRYKQVVYEEKRSRVEMLDAFFSTIGSQYDCGEFDYVIFSTDIPECTLDKKVYQLYFLKKYGFVNANYFTIIQQCGTQINAFVIAGSLINSGRAKKILIVSHSYKNNIKSRLLEGYGIIGDGVVGIVVAQDTEQLQFIDSYTKTNGEFYDLNTTPKEGMAYYQYLYNGVESINTLLHKNNISIKDVKLIIHQNVSALEWDFYCPRLKCSKEQVYLKNISRYGHLGDADAFINLKDAIDEGGLSKGDIVLVQSVGAGATFNSLLLKY